jgi:glutathione synthase/RimK-type ligase-like ATP-grasp enzyme
MKTLLVIDQKQDWLEVPDAIVMTARQYLAEPDTGPDASARVLNLCRAGRYQGRGYYVSLVAEARGQRPLPEVKTVEDLKSEAYVKTLSGELESLVQETLKHDESDRFELDVYLGKDPAERHQALAEKVFASVRAPLLRVMFARSEGNWRLDAVHVIGIADIPAQHRAFLLETFKAFVADAPASKRQPGGPPKARPRLAILWDPKEPHQPSNDEARQQFVKVAPRVGLDAELIELDALDRLPEFDALFNRASPEVDGVSYEFVRRAESLGMPVVDDPESILRCTNKVYMHELMNRHRIMTPRTLIVHRGNVQEIVPTLGLPCVLKLPDSGFGLDVVKIESEDELQKEAERFFNVSELFIAQEWLPSDFDWRVGVYDGRPLFVCKYFMAPGHWKILEVAEDKEIIEGESTTMTVGEAPADVVNMAVRAANLVGRGLYGVDLKQVENRVHLIEVNCNPNIDAGVEDEALGDALYREVLGVFARRIAESGSGA